MKERAYTTKGTKEKQHSIENLCALCGEMECGVDIAHR
jgi:hypothetical protein